MTRTVIAAAALIVSGISFTGVQAEPVDQGMMSSLISAAHAEDIICQSANRSSGIGRSACTRRMEIVNQLRDGGWCAASSQPADMDKHWSKCQAGQH